MRREKGFISFMKDDPKIKSDLAIKQRIRLIEKVEDILKMEIDDVVASDETMYGALIKLRPVDRSHNALQAALRKYYVFINGKKFPRLTVYEKQKGKSDNALKFQMATPIPVSSLDGYEFHIVITKERNYKYDSASLFLYTCWLVCKDTMTSLFVFETVDDAAPELTFDGIRMFDSLGGLNKLKMTHIDNIGK